MPRGQRQSAVKAKDDDERESEIDFSGEGSDEGHPKLDDDDPAEDDDEPESEEDESDELSPPPSPHKPRLKIKLKLPQILSPNASSSQSRAASSTNSRPSSHRGISRDVDADMDVDIESEDEDDDHDDAEDAYADGEDADGDGDERVGKSTRPMTSRQAVLASVVDSSHVSLSGSSRKKKQLTESEMALRREETARKRRNLTEKKLEDEKAETINRLLKKQSKSKKRNALSTAEDRTPVSATPAVVQTRDGSEVEGEAEPVEVAPTMYHWVSTTKSAASAKKDDGQMKLTFSVPVGALPPQGAQMPSTGSRPPVETPMCDVGGCERARKYRLVSDWVRGACGMAHLKMLEHQMDVV